MEAEDLLKDLKEFVSVETVHMYIIERKIKQEAKPKDKPSIKYDYIPLQVNVSKDLMPVISQMLEKVIERKVKEDVEIKNYEVIDDTLNKLYTYKDLGKIAGFQEFLKNRLGSEIKVVKSFKELEDLEKAWAICYGFYNKKKTKWLYCIKKLQPRKIAVETQTFTNTTDAVTHGFTTLFDLKTQTLIPLNGFSLNIEPSIDMIYYDEEIFIFQKKAFEDLTSLTEEFQAVAEEIVTEVQELEFIEGVEQISNIISSKPAFRDKLIKAKSIGNLDFLKACKNVKKEFLRVGKKIDIKFQFDEHGKIMASTNTDAENIIKVLCEFYKEGVFGGKIFESPAGRLKK